MDSSLPLVDRALEIFVVSVVMMVISVVAVVLRSFVRLYLVRGFGWDDALMVLALVLQYWNNLMTRKLTFHQSLFVFLGICCMIGSLSGVGHRMVEFEGLGALDELKSSLLVCCIPRYAGYPC
jgi:pectinesterase/phosphatidylserine decarboxylase